MGRVRVRVRVSLRTRPSYAEEESLVKYILYGIQPFLSNNWRRLIYKWVQENTKVHALNSFVVKMATSMGRPCQLCCCRIDDGKNRRNVGALKSVTAALDGLCSEVGQLRTQLVPGPVCRRCCQDLEKLTKAQSTVELLRGRFLCYLTLDEKLNFLVLDCWVIYRWGIMCTVNVMISGNIKCILKCQVEDRLNPRY